MFLQREGALRYLSARWRSRKRYLQHPERRSRIRKGINRYKAPRISTAKSSLPDHGTPPPPIPTRHQPTLPTSNTSTSTSSLTSPSPPQSLARNHPHHTHRQQICYLYSDCTYYFRNYLPPKSQSNKFPKKDIYHPPQETAINMSSTCHHPRLKGISSYTRLHSAPRKRKRKSKDNLVIMKKPQSQTQATWNISWPIQQNPPVLYIVTNS